MQSKTPNPFKKPSCTTQWRPALRLWHVGSFSTLALGSVFLNEGYELSKGESFHDPLREVSPNEVGRDWKAETLPNLPQCPQLPLRLSPTSSAYCLLPTTRCARIAVVRSFIGASKRTAEWSPLRPSWRRSCSGS